ncbi:MAG TPA: MFS transporter, partial [Streptosporangiaceae bacterium]|nr:MFS transporter [Streptosporangiaceae bacterium]
MGPNWFQFALLTLMTLLVGMTIGVERVVLPPLAHRAFGVTSLELTVSFVSAFGAVKATLNMFAGHWSDRLGRRGLMAAGWALGVPYPLLIAFAPSWGWVVVANLFLGANQGLAWTTSVTAKIDLVGPVRRGLAVGIDEAAGYVGTAVGGYAAGLIATSAGLRPDPYWLALGIIVLGGMLTLWPVRDTLPWAAAEAAQRPARKAGENQAPRPSLARLMGYMSWRDRAMFAACQGGTVNKFADALVIGMFPLWLVGHHVSVATVGLITGVYAAVWGFLQIPSGQAADRLGRKWLIAGGLIAEGVAVAWFVTGHGLATWLGAAIVMGIGTAALYPNLITAVSDISHPAWRGGSLGVYRLWRDGGYAIGPLITAGFATGFGLAAGFWFVAA